MPLQNASLCIGMRMQFSISEFKMPIFFYSSFVLKDTICREYKRKSWVYHGKTLIWSTTTLCFFHIK